MKRTYNPVITSLGLPALPRPTVLGSWLRDARRSIERAIIRRQVGLLYCDLYDDHIRELRARRAFHDTALRQVRSRLQATYLKIEERKHRYEELSS